jgi:Zn-dependent protease
MLLSIIAVIIAVFVHESVHRIFGLEQGYRTEYKPFFYGLIAGLVITFMSYGKLIFLAYSGVRLHIMEKHRLGYFRYQLGYFQLGKISAMGPLANLVVAIIFKFLTFLPATLVDKIVFVNVLFAITNMLPIPPLDGANVIYASRLAYFFMLGAVVAMGLLLIHPVVNIVYAFVIAIVFGIFTVLFYFRKVEPKIGGSW